MANMFSRRLWNEDFILILLVCSIASFTNSVFMNLLPVYVLDLGGSNADTGMMMTGLTVLGMITRVIVAPLIDRIGRKPLLLIGSSLYAANALCFCFTEDLTVIFILRVLHGFTQGIFFPVPPTMVADCTPEDLLVDGMGFFGISSSIMFAITPSIGLAIYENLGSTPLFLTATAAALIAFLLALPIKERYHRPAAEKTAEKTKKSFRLDSLFLFMVLTPSMISFFLYVGNSAITNYLTPCGLSRGIGQISLFFLVNNLAVIIARLLVGRVIHFLSRSVLIFIGIILCSGGTSLLAIAHSMSTVFFSAILIGVGITAVSQLLQVQVMTSVPEDRRGLANTTFMLLGDVGNGAGAAIWGAVSAGAGYTLTYALAGISILIACLFQGIYRRKGKTTLDDARKDKSGV